MAKRNEIVTALLAKAQEYEELGIQQFRRSASQITDIGYTEFNNARIWGERAQGFRRAAAFIDKEISK